MKKYILFLLWSVISFGQASNQMVSFTQAQSLGFSLKSGQSSVTSTQCMTKSEALAKYNLTVSAMDGYSSNQLVPKSAWVTASSAYSASLTVGSGTNSSYGYNSAGFGSITATSCPIAGSGAYVSAIVHIGVTGELFVVINNGSTTIAPNGWTTISINGTNYNRTSFSLYGASGSWEWTLVTANPLGTTVGATKTITIN